MILPKAIHKGILLAGYLEVYGTQCRKDKEPAEEVQHRSVRDRHLSHLRVIDCAVIVKNVEAIYNLSPKVDSQGLALTRKNVNRHDDAIFAASQAKNGGQNRATHLHG